MSDDAMPWLRREGGRGRSSISAMARDIFAGNSSGVPLQHLVADEAGQGKHEEGKEDDHGKDEGKGVEGERRRVERDAGNDGLEVVETPGDGGREEKAEHLHKVHKESDKLRQGREGGEREEKGNRRAEG